MTSALERLAGPGKSLIAEPPDTREFEGLVRSGLVVGRVKENTGKSHEFRVHYFRVQ